MVSNININPFSIGRRRQQRHLGVGNVESQTVVETRVLAALQLSLSHRSLESYIPQPRSLRLVSLTTRKLRKNAACATTAGTPTNSLVGEDQSTSNQEYATDPQTASHLQRVRRSHGSNEVTARNGHLIASLNGLTSPPTCGAQNLHIRQRRIAATPKKFCTRRSVADHCHPNPWDRTQPYRAYAGNEPPMSV